MARFGSIPKVFGRVHPRYLTPDVSTLVMGAVSLIWTLFIINVSQNVLADSISALGFQICFYYGLTGFACAIYYRKELFKSAKNFFLVGADARSSADRCSLDIFVKALTIDHDPVNSQLGRLPRHRGGRRDRRRVAAGRRHAAGHRQLRLSDVLQAQVGGRRPRHPHG